MIRRALLLALALVMTEAAPAAAHKASDSYLGLTVTDSAVVDGQWDLALRDLEAAVGVDADGDGAITWGELQARGEAVTTYALSRLELAADGRLCPAAPAGLLFDRHSDGGYAVLRFTATCQAVPRVLTVRYDLLFDIDSLHRGLLRVTAGEHTHAAILSPDARLFQVTTGAAPDIAAQLLAYGVEGVWHIWIGFDHILFLLSLLLPAVLRRREGRWQPVGSLREAAVEVLKVVTAFTLAHSVTLTLATLGVVALPSRLVETAIAASVVLAALNNLYPLVDRRLWLVAFGFGLIHGLGFAGALAELGLPQQAMQLSLLAFNLGVELGQLAIVAVFLPMAFLLRGTSLYPPLVLRAGSTAIATIACFWLIERGLDVALI